MKIPGARTLAAIGLLVWLVLHIYWSLHTEVNWDEFALLARASDSLREGRVLSGGRPGLATLALMPLVDGCSDALATARLARLWWTPFTLGILVGLWLTLVKLFSNRAHATTHALMGVSLIALTPYFMRFAVQVRSDQPAIAMGLLAGALLIDSRRYIRIALCAGLLFGVGYLFSQKLLYVGALVGLLAAADPFLKENFDVRREVGRVLAVVGGFLVALLVFRGLVTVFWEPPPQTDYGSQMDVFSYYRDTVGYRHYGEMLPQLIAPVGLLVVLLILLPSALWRGGRDQAIAFLCISVLGLGAGVGIFHAGAFPYFWMTLGLFPAVTLAIGLSLFQRLSKRTRRRIFAPFWVVFALPAIVDGAMQTRDLQAVQRETLNFVDANIRPDIEGFHDTRALFCRELGDPLPTFFIPEIGTYLYGEGGQEAVDDLISEFRKRPIGFLIHTFRLERFPERMRHFWAEHYVAYSGAVLLAGTSLDDVGPRRIEFEVLVPGTYQFRATDTRSNIWIGTSRLNPGDRIWLDIGYHTIDKSGVTGTALLALSIAAPPGPARNTFYLGF